MFFGEVMLKILSTLTLALLLAACADQSADVDTSADQSSEDPDLAAKASEFTEDMQVRADDFGPRDQMPGAGLFGEHCASCHNGSVPKAPHLHWMEMMSPRNVLAAMNEGIMAVQAAHLSDEQKQDIAEYVTMKSARSMASQGAPVACEGTNAEFDLNRLPAQVGWGHDTSRYAGADVAGLTADDVPKLKLKWAFAYPGALRARSQPAVGMGAIFTGSQDGNVYAFDLETGCARWTFNAGAEVRTGVVLTQGEHGRAPLAVFGNIVANLFAVNALTGELVWSVKIDDHPSATLTGTPALNGNQLFVPVSSLEVIPAANPQYECCTFRGKIVSLNVADGAEIWTHYTIPTPPAETGLTSAGTKVFAPSGAPSWTSPAVDRRRNVIYVGTGENYSSPADENSDAILAIDMTTGERVWQRQSTSGDAWNVACMMVDNPNCPEEQGPDFDHGSSMILIDLPDGRQVLTVGHKNGTIFGLDPDNQGSLLWSTKVGRGSIQGGVHFGMAADGTTLYAPINDMNNTRNGDVLDPEAARPGVHALNAANGELQWSHVQTNVCPPDMEFCDPGISAPVTAIDGAVFAGHLDGFLRAYSRSDGRLLWEFDTNQPTAGVNGETAQGGGMSGAGPTIVDGHVIVNSGYGLYFHSPGNMLAVFSVDGK